MFIGLGMRLNKLLAVGLAIVVSLGIGSEATHADDLRINLLKADSAVTIAQLRRDALLINARIYTAVRVRAKNGREVVSRVGTAQGARAEALLRRMQIRDGRQLSLSAVLQRALLAVYGLHCSMNTRLEKIVSSPIWLSRAESRNLIRRPTEASRLQRGVSIARAEKMKMRLSRALTRLERRINDPRTPDGRIPTLNDRRRDLRVLRTSIDQEITALLNASVARCGA